MSKIMKYVMCLKNWMIYCEISSKLIELHVAKIESSYVSFDFQTKFFLKDFLLYLIFLLKKNSLKKLNLFTYMQYLPLLFLWVLIWVFQDALSFIINMLIIRSRFFTFDFVSVIDKKLYNSVKKNTHFCRTPLIGCF